MSTAIAEVSHGSVFSVSSWLLQYRSWIPVLTHYRYSVPMAIAATHWFGSSSDPNCSTPTELLGEDKMNQRCAQKSSFLVESIPIESILHQIYNYLWKFDGGGCIKTWGVGYCFTIFLSFAKYNFAPIILKECVMFITLFRTWKCLKSSKCFVDWEWINIKLVVDWWIIQLLESSNCDLNLLFPILCLEI